MNRSTLACGIGLAAMLAACAAESGRAAPPAATPPAAVEEDTPMSGTPAALTEAILRDAAKRTGLSREELAVASTERVTWADGSLGCAEPGQSYTMALVPGYRIFVRAGPELLDYHANEAGYFVLCPPGRGANPAVGTTS